MKYRPAANLKIVILNLPSHYPQIKQIFKMTSDEMTIMTK